MRKRLLTATLVVAAVVGGWAPSSDASASITEVGWWTSNPTASAPEGGLNVQAGPNGSVVSVAAVRIAVTSRNLTSASLVLAESGGVGASNGALRVCPTPNQWKATQKGAAAEAPKPECERGEAKLERNPNTGVWAGDVLSLLRSSTESTVSLMVVPAGGGAVPVGFEVQFRKPELAAEGTAADVSDDAEFSPGFSDDDSGSSDDRFSSGGTSNFAFDDFSGTSSLGSESFSPGTLEGATDQTPAAVADALPAEARGDNQVAVGLPASLGTATPKGFPLLQGLFFVGLATAIGVAAGVGHRFRRLSTVS